jgi:hypothetical protein
LEVTGWSPVKLEVAGMIYPQDAVRFRQLEKRRDRIPGFSFISIKQGEN